MSNPPNPALGTKYPEFDPRIMDIVDALIRQNGMILAMNAELLAAVARPAYFVTTYDMKGAK